MKIYMLLLLALFTMSCGGPYKVQLQGPDKPIVVDHRIDLSGITDFFNTLCQETLPINATPQDIQNCTNNATSQFLNRFANTTIPSGSTTTTTTTNSSSGG